MTGIAVRKIQKVVWVTFQKVGYHKYPNAPADVGYLANEHRHIFKFRASLSVATDNREIEFHQLLRELELLYGADHLRVDHKSCEMMAVELHDYLVKAYPGRAVTVEVSEDGECGSTVSSHPA